MAKWIGVVIVVAIVGVVLVGKTLQSPETPATPLDEFAQCLRGKGVVMYGADWCSHCQNEKRAFGSSFRFVPYVECPKEPKRCLSENINGYPTWIFPDGRRLEGEQGLGRLAEVSGCLLPPSP